MVVRSQRERSAMSPAGPWRCCTPPAASSSVVPPLRLAALALLGLALPSARADHGPFGYQSGDSTLGDPSKSSPSDSLDQDSYPGAVHYDPRTKLLYITGGTYGSYFDVANTGGTGGTEGDTGVEADCFLAVLKVPDGGDGDGDDEHEENHGSPRSEAGERQNALPDPSSRLGLVHSFRIGTVDHPETCSSLDLLPPGDGSAAGGDDNDLKTHLALVGHTLEGGYLTGLRQIGSKKATGYGYALEVELDLTGVAAASSPGTAVGSHKIDGGRLFHSSKVQYPVAVAVPPSGDGEAAARAEQKVMYVALLDTDDDAVNPRHDSSTGSTPDLTAGADPYLEDGVWDDGAVTWHRYGKSFDVTILKVERKSPAEIAKDEEQADRAGGPDYPLKESMKVLWEQPFATAEEGADGSHPGVLLADLMYVPHAEASGSLVREDFLLMAGSTEGYGSAFGSEVRMDGDWDGFLTKLDPATGEELVPPAGVDEMLRHPHSLRIRSENGMDDIVRGICIQPDQGDVRSAYVVGSTRGIFDVESLPGGRDANNDPMEPLPASSAWIAMVDLDGMVVRWKRQFTSDKGVVSSGCAVSPDGKVVYVAGTVSDGGVVMHKSLPKTKSRGKDDVFVAKLDAADGDVVWFEQTGTAEDEWLAKGGGIVAGEDGGAVLYGGTRGSLMRWRGSGAHDHDDDNGERRVDEHGPMAADVFVMSVSKDGQFLPSQDEATHTDDSPAGDGGGHKVPGGSSGDAPTFPDQPSGNQDNGQAIGMSPGDTPGESISKSLGFFLLAVAGVVVALLLFVSAYRIGQSRARSGYGAGEISHEHVTKYLQDFDEVDVAIRASATGGWHGMYDFGDEHSQLMAGLGKVPDEVTVTLSQISKDGTGGSNASVHSGGGASRPEGLLRSGSVHSIHSAHSHHSGSAGASVHSASQRSTHASVVKDALFFEDDEVTARRPHRASFTINDGDDRDHDEVMMMDDDEHGEPGTPWGAGYEGLVESYNDTWADRNPHSLGGGGGGAMPGGGMGEYGEEADPKLNEIL